MTAYVVDTNVAIAANGRGDVHADEECQLACREKLKEVCSPHSRQVVVVDNEELVFDEYSKHLNWKGAPGLGDMFFKHIFVHQHVGKRVHRVPITPCSDPRRGFEELPTNDLDPSDRKFLATAVAAKDVVGKTDILNATDSDWEQQKELTKSLGVDVRQLCPKQCLKTVKPARLSLQRPVPCSSTRKPPTGPTRRR